jgi:hypothetical protein
MLPGWEAICRLLRVALYFYLCFMAFAALAPGYMYVQHAWTECRPPLASMSVREVPFYLHCMQAFLLVYLMCYACSPQQLVDKLCQLLNLPFETIVRKSAANRF